MYASVPSVADTGSAATRMPLTDWPVYSRDVPKSPRAVFASIFPYCTYHGRSRPYFARMFCSTAGGSGFSPV